MISGARQVSICCRVIVLIGLPASFDKVLSIRRSYSVRVLGLSGCPFAFTCCSLQCLASSLRVMVLGSRSPACGVSSTCHVPLSTAPRILVSSNSAWLFTLKVVLAVRLMPFGSVYLTWYLPLGSFRIEPSPRLVFISCPIRAQYVPNLFDICCYLKISLGSDISRVPNR